MEHAKDPRVCPHCGARMKVWASPADSTWGGDRQFVCFNDECSYYAGGWTWMEEKFNVRSSYRHHHNPRTGESGPLPVWSRDALKNQVVEDDTDAGT